MVDVVKLMLTAMLRPLGYQTAGVVYPDPDKNPIVAVWFTRQGGNGVLPGGVVAYDRGRSPLGDDCTYVVHSFSLRESGMVSLSNGDYDLTLDDALRVGQQRADRELGAYGW